MDDLGLASLRVRAATQTGGIASSELDIISDAERRWRRARIAMEVAEDRRRDNHARWRSYIESCRALAQKDKERTAKMLAAESEISVTVIIETVSQFYDKRPDQLISATRSQVLAKPRHVAMYLARTLTTRSYPELGRLFGGRDHTTIIYAYDKIAALIETNDALAEEVETLHTRLKSRPSP